MSVKVMGKVWDSDLPRPEKYVLLSYADHAAHDGSSIYPSMERMAWKTGYTKRSIQKITRRLEDKEILVQVNTLQSGVKEYWLDMSKLPSRASYGEDEKSSPLGNQGAKKLHGGVKKSTDRGEKSSPESSLTVSESSKDNARENAESDSGDTTAPSESEASPNVENSTEGESGADDGRRDEEDAGESELDAFGLTGEKWHEKYGHSDGRAPPSGSEPWLQWGADSRVISRRGDVPKQCIQRIGHKVEDDLGRFLDWTDKSEVKRWVNGCAKLYRIIGEDLEVLEEAHRRLSEDGMTLASPWSYVKTCKAIASEGGSSPAPVPEGEVFR